MSQTTHDGHVGPIIFSNATAREQLAASGEVVTFRKSERTTGDTWWRQSRLGEKEGDVTVRELKKVDPSTRSELRPYQPQSGFESIRDWQRAIRSLNGTMPDRGILYHVVDRDT